MSRWHMHGQGNARPIRRRLQLIVGIALAVFAVTATPALAADSSASGNRTTLGAGDTLDGGQFLSDGQYALWMQRNGNLVLYRSGHQIWNTGTKGNAGAHATMRRDGNLVIEHGKTVLWSSETAGTGVTHAFLQKDGEFGLFTRGNDRVWASGTQDGRDEMLQSDVYYHAFRDLGSRPYSWAAGHAAKPGPTFGQCEPPSVGNAGCKGLHLFGFDCSGFTRWVYYQASGRDLLGAGNTDNQIAEMHRTTDPAPGDLAFFGSSTSSTDHVGIYIGHGEMINAFETGTRIQINQVADGGHLLGYWHF